jgi:hypothetical protein
VRPFLRQARPVCQRAARAALSSGPRNSASTPGIPALCARSWLSARGQARPHAIAGAPACSAWSLRILTGSTPRVPSCHESHQAYRTPMTSRNVDQLSMARRPSPSRRSQVLAPPKELTVTYSVAANPYPCKAGSPEVCKSASPTSKVNTTGLGGGPIHALMLPAKAADADRCVAALIEAAPMCLKQRRAHSELLELSRCIGRN